MAEPRTEWGQQAVEDIHGLQAGVADLGRRVGALEARGERVEGKLDDLRAEIATMGERFADRFDTMHAEFAEFRGLVKGVGYTLCVLVTVFGAMVAAGGAWVAKTVVEHDTEIRHLAEQGADGPARGE